MASRAVFTRSSRLGLAPSGSIFGCRRVGRPVGASGLACIDFTAWPRKARLRSAFVGRRSTASADRSSVFTPYGRFGGSRQGCSHGICTCAPTAPI
ncbi:hypothetical protein ACWD1W_40965 [Streptomyces olivaceoviridis]